MFLILLTGFVLTFSRVHGAEDFDATLFDIVGSIDAKNVFVTRNSFDSIDDAAAACRAGGGQPFSPDTNEQNEYVKQFLRGYNRASQVYLGIWRIGRDGTEESSFYAMKNGQSVSEGVHDFNAGEPNNNLGIEPCVQMWQECDFRWNDVPCNYIAPILCEINNSEPSTTSSPEKDATTDIQQAFTNQEYPTDYPTTDYTNYPTTEYPTTKNTEFPTTDYPTTEFPNTEYPSTEYPTTDYPTTEYATTDYHTTKNTEFPTTDYPTTEYPTTDYTDYTTTENRDFPTTEYATTENTDYPTTSRPDTTTDKFDYELQRMRDEIKRIAQLVEANAISALSVLDAFRNTLEIYEKELELAINQVGSKLGGSAKTDFNKLANLIRDQIKTVDKTLDKLERRAKSALREAQQYERAAQHLEKDLLEEAKQALYELNSEIFDLLDTAEYSLSGYLDAIASGISNVRKATTSPGIIAGLLNSLKNLFSRFG